MTKQDLVNYVAEKVGLTKADATRAVEAYNEAITAALKKGEKVTLTGFVTYAVEAKPAKTGRNPRTGETVKIPAKKVVKIKAGSKLKEAVN